MNRLPPLASKALALLVLLLVVALLVAAVALPVWLFNVRYDSALEDATSKLDRYARIAGMREGLQKKIVEVKALAANHHFLKSASPALAAAELQEQVKTIIEASGGKVNSVQILPHKDEGLYRQVTVSFQLTSSLPTLKKLLHGLESARPYVFIDNFSARSSQGYGARNATAPEPDLIVQFDLTGYALKGAQ
jgi:general secretion pathway protein M